jgi:hypothetical protein
MARLPQAEVDCWEWAMSSAGDAEMCEEECIKSVSSTYMTAARLDGVLE